MGKLVDGYHMAEKREGKRTMVSADWKCRQRTMLDRRPWSCDSVACSDSIENCKCSWYKCGRGHCAGARATDGRALGTILAMGPLSLSGGGSGGDDVRINLFGRFGLGSRVLLTFGGARRVAEGTAGSGQ